MAGRSARGGPSLEHVVPSETAPSGRIGAALAVRGAVCRFGDVTAVDDVSLAIPAGGALGLIGPNGAGKSTLLAALGGQVGLRSGAVMLDGYAVQTLPPHARAICGIQRTFQIPRPFRRLTVLENLKLAALGQPGERPLVALLRGAEIRADDRRAEDSARALLNLLGLDGHRNAPAGTLSGGQLKLLDLARALLGAPRLLLLDEPCAGVHPRMIEVLSGMIERVRAGGVTVVIVEHNVDFVVRHCDRAAVMVQGRVQAQGAPAEIRRDPRVLEAFMGVAIEATHG
jgi:branched-chain amino acid transport system ATP-binding protein